MCIEAKKLGIERAIVPIENAKEASVVNGIKIFGAETLKQVVDFLNGIEDIKQMLIRLKQEIY